jgi:hypothetical protein
MSRQDKLLPTGSEDRLTLTREFKTRHPLMVGRSGFTVLVRASSINLLLMLSRKGPKSPTGLEIQERGSLRSVATLKPGRILHVRIVCRYSALHAPSHICIWSNGLHCLPIEDLNSITQASVCPNRYYLFSTCLLSVSCTDSDELERQVLRLLPTRVE